MNHIIYPQYPSSIIIPDFTVVIKNFDHNKMVKFTKYDHNKRQISLYVIHQGYYHGKHNISREAKVIFPISTNGKIYGAHIISNQKTSCEDKSNFIIVVTCNFCALPEEDFQYFKQIYFNNIPYSHISACLDILLMESILILPGFCLT